MIILSLHENDFSFCSKNRSEKEVKCFVRRKIKILPLLPYMFESSLLAEEDFIKGKAYCSLATADSRLTMGFVDDTILRPKTLLKNNELDSCKSVNVTLVLRRIRGAERFDTIVQGDLEGFCPNLYY